MSDNRVTWVRLHIAIGVKLGWDTIRILLRIRILRTRLVELWTPSRIHDVICDLRCNIPRDEEWNSNLNEVSKESYLLAELSHRFNAWSGVKRKD